MGLERGAGKSKVYQYFDAHGKGRRVEKMRDFLDWLDEMWMCHPPEVHVYDVEALVQEAEDRMGLIEEIFEKHDLDRSGTMSASELRDMLLQ